MWLHEDWFSDQDRIRGAVGLIGADEEAEEVETITTTMTCGICAEGDKPASEMASAGCAHRYCHHCWRRYVAAAIEGNSCLALRCPDASCSRAVLRGTVQRFAAPIEDDDDVYERLLARDYVHARGLWMKPCPAPGCGRVIDLTVPLPRDAGGDADVLCLCGNGFCWRCGGSPHWPSTWAAVARFWTCEADEASALWVALHTKPCPQCRRPIERRTGGCRYMTCAAPCFQPFCWRCLGPTTQSFFNHDLYFEATRPKEEEEVWRARQALERFLHYQDLWSTSLHSRRKAEHEAARVLGEMPRLTPRNALVAAEVAAAWEAVAEGRRVLGNACAHGLGLRGADKRRREVFDYQHGEAEAVLDCLQQEAAAAAANLDRFIADYLAYNQLAVLTRVDNFASGGGGHAARDEHTTGAH